MLSELNSSLTTDLALVFGGFSISALCTQLMNRVKKADSEHLSYMQAFIEQAPAAIAMFDKNMHYIAASKRWLSDYRIEDRQVLRRSHYDVFPEIPDRWRESTHAA